MAEILAEKAIMDYEKITAKVYPSLEKVSHLVAGEIAKLISSRQKAGKNAVLGLATGSTPISVYTELIRLHKEEGLSFANVITFNLDEYYPMAPDDGQSYVRFMNEQLFNHVDIDKTNVYIPDGTITRGEVPGFCAGYEKKIRDAGGIDIQLLGIGRNGHIGFNEPGSSLESRTRLVTLDEITRENAISDFGAEEKVPREAITMGVATILESRKIFLVAFGTGKAKIIQRTVEGDISESVPATWLQRHHNTTFFLDKNTSIELNRFKKS